MANVAADAEAAIAAELSLAVEHRKAGHLDGQTFACVIDRPRDGNAAPRLARRQRAGDLIVRIEFQIGGDIAPQSAERGCGAWSGQFGELVGADNKAAVGVHLPDKAQRVTPLQCGFAMRIRAVRLCSRGRG